MTVFRRLKLKMKMKKLKVITVPHMINNHQKKERVRLGQLLLNQLTLFNNIDVITSDESWFYMSYTGDSMWVRNKNEIDFLENRNIGSEKYMISIFWNFNDLFIIEIVPEGESFNSEFVTKTLFPKLEKVPTYHRPTRGLKSFVLHLDNPKTTHLSKNNSFN